MDREVELNEWREAGKEIGRKLGVVQERKRIVKLLEAWGEDAGCYCCASDVAAAEIIELIKGKSK